MKLFEKKRLEQKRRYRIRKKINGTAERPRLSLCLTNKHIYAQCIDDVCGNTICMMSSLTKDLRERHLKPNVGGSVEFGKVFGEFIKSRGITSVVFDRAGRAYHGCVKGFADAVREQGIEF